MVSKISLITPFGFVKWRHNTNRLYLKESFEKNEYAQIANESHLKI
jgi:hypothetical protein